jgi:hypothetical protein
VGRTLQTALAGLAILLAAIASGCGGESTTSSSTTVQPEVAEKLPKLARGWKARRDTRIGYAIGVPPGWQLRQQPGRVLFRAPDHLVAVSLSVDRNGDALSLPLDEFATRTLMALPGFEKPLHPSHVSRFRGTPLEAVQAAAKGKTKRSGIEERVALIVLRRDQVVNYTAAVVENAERGYSRLDRAVALRMIRTLRDQPVQTAVSPESR